MFSDIFGFAGYGGYGWDGPDRRNWRDKSDAAIRRENDAKSRFHAFLERSKKSTEFPVTEEVVPPAVHLTDACWKTFKQHVLAAGCTTKRREATREERIASKQTRQGKLYVISVTVPVHPDQAKEVAREKKIKAEAVAELKKQKAAAAAEKKRLEAAKKAEEELELQEKVKEEYAAVVESMDTKKRVLTDHNTKSEDASPAKKIKLTAPTPAILIHAEKMHQDHLSKISSQVYQEKNVERQRLLQELEERMKARETALKQEAREHCDKIKSAIQAMAENK